MRLPSLLAAVAVSSALCSALWLSSGCQDVPVADLPPDGVTAGAAGSVGSAGRAGGGGRATNAVPPSTRGSLAPLDTCFSDAECEKLLPETVPTGCAAAACEAGKCIYGARDADGDGAPTRACKSKDPSFVFAVGGDCDDANTKVHPGAWDGPATKGEENRCGDGVDQDCSGADGDSVTDAGASCECVPGDVGPCEQDSGGRAIAFPEGALKGECKRGSRTCEVSSLTGGGKWGPCTGAVAPEVEECNGKDDDCDGAIDDDAIDRATFTCDADADNHLPVGAATTLACFAPTEGCAGKWQDTAPVDDCNDADPLAFKGRAEQCDGVDNDCANGADDGFACVKGSSPVAATTCPGQPAASDVPCKRYCDAGCSLGGCFADGAVEGSIPAELAAPPECKSCGPKVVGIIPQGGAPLQWKADLAPGKYRVFFELASTNTSANTLGAMIAESLLPDEEVSARANSWFNFREQGGTLTVDLPVDACGQKTTFYLFSSVPAAPTPPPSVVVKSLSWKCVEGACMTKPGE